MGDGTKGTRAIAVIGTALGQAPVIIRAAGGKAARRYFEFFTAQIRNRNTREAYYRALSDFFAWCDDRRLQLDDIEPMVVAAYIEYLMSVYSKPTVKQHLAAIRMCLDWLVVGQILPMNPASSVRGPSYTVKRGKTPVLSAEEARKLLSSIDVSTLLGLRDRAIIAVMVYSFARVTAVVGMKVADYFKSGKRMWFRFHEKGGKLHEVPVHHAAEEFLDAYLRATDFEGDKPSPLFRAAGGKFEALSENPLSRHDVFRMIQRRAKAAGLPHGVCCHTFRATGITAYLENGGTIEKAQAIAGHESPRTTKLYDRTDDAISLDEVERILI